MRVISFMNYKGGVGKTTLAANIGAGLADRGKNVLMIDLDPQANLTDCFFPPINPDADLHEDQTIKRWFTAHINGSHQVPPLSELVLTPTFANASLRNQQGRISIIASHLSLLDIDMDLAAWLFADDGLTIAKRTKLHRFLADGLEDHVLSDYDYVLIDCAPDFGIVTRIAMVASDFVVVPAKPDPLSTKGISYLVKSLRRLVAEYNSLNHPAIRQIRPEFLGIVYNMVQVWSSQPTSTQQLVIGTVNVNGIDAFETKIRTANRATITSTSSGIPSVLSSAVDGDIVMELNALTDEFLRRIERFV